MAAPTSPEELEALRRAKENKRTSNNIDALVDKTFNCRPLYDEVLRGIASNVKMGPFTATSGVILQYYLNAATNFLDKNISPKIAELVAMFLQHILPKDQQYVICGMEMAGGIMASQLAVSKSKLNEFCDFLYVRKAKKETGTAQQLEGPVKYTTRNRSSPTIIGVWVDDALSTGSSLKDGIKVLRSEYNIDVRYVLYLVDRQKDRAELPPQSQHLADPVLKDVRIIALYDMDQVDALIVKPS